MPDASSSPDPIAMPQQFRGIFTETRERFAPMLLEARATLREHPAPAEVRPYYAHGVLDHAQPSFMLLPMMYLALAERAGGVTARHRRYLPWYMLAMELVAVLDDTVDATPLRSGRLTYPERFGDASATSFSAYLLATVFERTAATTPEVMPLVSELFTTLCALQTWEHHARYPAPDEAGFRRWLQLHYDAVTPAVAHSLNSALALHGRPPVPREACARFGEIMQDVDDVVNLVENRETAGENDDLKMGIVTHPLLATLRAAPETRAVLELVWRPYRAMDPSRRGLAERMARCSEVTAHEHAALAALVARHGVPATIRKIVRDASACVAATPDPVRACVRDMVLTFVDRLRRMDAIRRDVDDALEAESHCDPPAATTAG